MSILTELPKSLRSAIRRHRVPGASLAVYRNGRVTEAAAGVVNVDTGVKTTPDSVFQIGSISKILTTTLVMQLVDEGLVDLDQPLRDYLSNFQVSDATASKTATLRQLLCHTGGFEGDLFVDSGRGDDCVARLQDMGRLLPQLFAPGERLSYCNFGFAMLGRMLEVVSGKTYDALLAERIFRPLGMHHALSLPEDCVKYRCAIGHVPDPKHKGAPMLSPMPWLSQGQKAAGATPSMSAGDLMRFVAMHLDGGTSREGERVLSRSSVRKMQQRQFRLPRGARSGVSGWGLGWFLDDWSGHKVFGHDGGTVGQYSFLRVLPEKNLAVALLTNGGDAVGLYEETFANLFQTLARVSLPALPEPVPFTSTMLESLPGNYENLTGSIDIISRRNELAVRITPKPGLTGGVSPTNAPLQALSRNLLKLVSDDVQAARTTFAFEGESEGRAEFVRMGMRLYKRC